MTEEKVLDLMDQFYEQTSKELHTDLFDIIYALQRSGATDEQIKTMCHNFPLKIAVITTEKLLKSFNSL